MAAILAAGKPANDTPHGCPRGPAPAHRVRTGKGSAGRAATRRPRQGYWLASGRVIFQGPRSPGRAAGSVDVSAEVDQCRASRPAAGSACCSWIRSIRPGLGRDRVRGAQTGRCPAGAGAPLRAHSRPGSPLSSPASARDCRGMVTSGSLAHRRPGLRVCSRAPSANRPQPAQIASQSVTESRSKLGTEWVAETKRFL